MANIQRSAQIYYGWSNWNDPMTRLLDEANRRYIEHCYSGFGVVIWDIFAPVAKGRPL